MCQTLTLPLGSSNHHLLQIAPSFLVPHRLKRLSESRSPISVHRTMPDVSAPQVQHPLNGSSSGNPATNGTLKKGIFEKLIDLVNASYIRSAWFVSNLVVVYNGLLYLQPFVGGPTLYALWYRLTFLGAFSTFAIVLYQNLSSFKSTAGSWKIRPLLQDDNVHYLYDATIWLLFPRQWLAMVPFLVFSLFHVLTFTGKEILPAIGIFPGVAQKMTSFSAQNHEPSRIIAATSELLLFIVLVVKAILFYKWAWFALGAYSIFIKVKSEGSIFTRNVLKDTEVRIDGLVSNQSIPPAVKSTWGSLKRFVKSLDKISIIKRVEAEAQKTN